MGKLAAEHGWRVILSSYVIEHRIGSQGFRANMPCTGCAGRAARGGRVPAATSGSSSQTRSRSRCCSIALKPGWWPVLALTALLRALAAWAVAGWVLHDPLTARRWWLVPVQDVVSFCFWLAGFFGNTIEWRGRPYHLRADGRFEPRG